MKRKDFLKISGGLALTGLASNKIFAALSNDEAEGKIKNFGLQLYTLRIDMPKDPKGVLKQVASFGYKQIESYEGPKGMFWGMTNKDFKSYMDDLGMNLVTSHCNIYKDFEKKVDEAAAIGMKYLVCPSIAIPKNMEGLKQFAELFNKCGQTCKNAGIRFAFHNHDGEFKKIDDQVILEYLLEKTDPSLVDYELDIYWVVTSNADPEEWMRKYKNRFRLCHVKDRIKNTTDREASCVVGTGSINFPKILKTAKQCGMQYYIIEQERYDGTTPLKAAEVDAAYMKALKI